MSSSRKRQRISPPRSPPPPAADVLEETPGNDVSEEEVLPLEPSYDGRTASEPSPAHTNVPSFSLPAVHDFSGELSEPLQRLAYIMRKQETEDNSVLFQELDGDTLTQRHRDFENLAFRLSLEESTEIRRGRELKVLSGR
mmetsp:Transcript_94192/g.269723  ORF Transcript_94192/g.269723 Transcript_94192/m.269723 type:complete len:140 (+) Transcript_94192:128-547(+)